LQGESGGLFLQPYELLLEVFVFVVLHASDHVRMTELEHAVDRVSQLLSHGGDGLGGSEAAAQTAEFGSQGALAADAVPGR
jgi:hypothetical protein